MKKTLIVIISLYIFTFFVFQPLNAQTCRTPGYNRTVIFMPAAYHLNSGTPGDYSDPCQNASQHHQYIIDTYIENSNPGINPQITLTDFINEMQSSNIGIMYFDSHAGNDNISIEFFENTTNGLAEAQSRYSQYITDPDIDPSFIGIYSSSTGYSIGVTDDGLDHWCTNLNGAIVYAKACHSSGLNDNWHSLVALGYDETISGYARNNIFFERVDGTRDRGPGNTRRSVEDATDGIITYHPFWPLGPARLEVFGNENVVLSPVVLSHQPESTGLVEEGQVGFVEFDCEMDQTVQANDVITINGTIGELTNVHWVNDHRIDFTITDLVEFATVDFKVHADKAISAHNGSQLDGNNNPNETDGVGPNGDFYNWSSLTSYFAMMDFEDGLDGEPIQSNIPGMEFITTQGYDWIYGDKSTGNYNIYPYNEATYWCNGNFFAWLGTNQGSGRINFTGATATSVSMGTSCYSGLYLEAYNGNGYLIDSDYVSGNLNTNTLSQITVTGAGIDHIIVHDAGNYWLIDDLVVVDLLQETLILLPENFAEILNELHTISPGGVENFLVWIDDIAENLIIILNWLGGGKDDAEMKLTIFKPDGSIYDEYQSMQPPIDMSIADPVMGNWIFEVTAINLPEDNFPFAIVAATENESVVDCYIQNDDICFYPEEPFEGYEINIFAKIHNSTQSEFVDYVKARCYLGDPDNGGIQIDDDEYAINISPGSVDTVYFNMDSANLGGENNIFIKIDPDNELDEYNEDNNKASNNIFIFQQLGFSIEDDVAENAWVIPGDYIEYTINFDNELNNTSVDSVLIQDNLPSDTLVSFISASGNYDYDSDDGTVTWNIGTLAAGATPQSVWFNVQVNSSIDDTLIITNYCTIESEQTPQKVESIETEVCLSPFVSINGNIYIYPNPFNPDDEVGTIRYSLSEDGKVTIKIYDVSGSLVTTLIEDEPQYAEDEKSVEWNGKNDDGKIVANGVYFYVIESSSGERAVGKAAVIK